MIAVASIGAAAIGLLMMVVSAMLFAVSPFQALFVGGIGAILLGLGGVARVSIPGGAIVGSAGFVMMVVASFGPHLL